MSDDERETDQLQFRVRPSIKKATQQAAADHNTSVAGLLKTLLLDFLIKNRYIQRDKRK